MTEQANLPEGWEWVPLGTLVENHDRTRVPLKVADRAKRPGPYDYYGASGVIDHIDDYLFDGHYLLIAEDGANLLSRSKPIAFDARGKFWVNNHAHVVGRGESNVPLEYVRDYLNGVDISDFCTGTAQPKLTRKNLDRIPVPLAPADERSRIVDKVEALSSRRLEAKAALDEVPALLDRLRQSILAAAFRGDLTADWRAKNPDVEPADKLLERIRVERRRRWEEAELAKMRAKGKEPKNEKWKGKYKEAVGKPSFPRPQRLPPSWGWVTLGELLSGIEPGKSPKAEGRPATGDEFGVLKVSAVTWGEFDATENKALLGGMVPEDRWLVRSGDLLITRANTVELVGAVVVVREDHPNLMLSDKTLRLVPTLPELTEFLLFALRSTWVRSVFEDNATGTSNSMRNLSQEKIRSAPIPLPPLDEALEVASRLGAAGGLVTETEHITNAASDELGNLERSVLAAAFRGEL